MIESYLDYMRVAVMIFSAGVMILILKTAWRNIRRLWSAGDMRFLIWGQLFRASGLTALMLHELYEMYERLGNRTFSWDTPIVQLATICLLLAWHFLDRRAYSRINVEEVVDMMRSNVNARTDSMPRGRTRIGDA